ncbi:MAG: hypothetical protein J5726_08460 [Treponema sp.]|nr:hypothetical protein [Treponema sp.]
MLNTDPNYFIPFAGNCLCVAGSGTKNIYYEVSVSFKAYTQDPDDRVAIICDFSQIAPYSTSIYARGDGTMTSQTFLVKPTSINFFVYSFAPKATIEYYIYVKKIELPD